VVPQGLVKDVLNVLTSNIFSVPRGTSYAIYSWCVPRLSRRYWYLLRVIRFHLRHNYSTLDKKLTICVLTTVFEEISSKQIGLKSFESSTKSASILCSMSINSISSLESMPSVSTRIVLPLAPEVIMLL
jgi:hypothetical protein